MTAAVNDIILGLVFDNGMLGSDNLGTQLIHPVPQPRRRPGYRLVFGVHLIKNERSGHGIGDLRSTLRIGRLKPNLDHIGHS